MAEHHSNAVCLLDGSISTTCYNLAMQEPENAGAIRNDKGQFLPGVSGNPAGKPTGTVSIVAKIKQKFLDDPDYFDEWVAKLMEDPSNRKAILEQIDGKPKQAMDITSGGKAIAGFNFIKNGGDNTDNTADA
jgi:hypothetical protein